VPFSWHVVCPGCEGVGWGAGEQLSTGWETVLRLLEIVPKGEEAATVSLAFQSVQLVAADLMPSLPANLLRSSLEVVSLYATQQASTFPSTRPRNQNS
jgi:hypothetical protein